MPRSDRGAQAACVARMLKRLRADLETDPELRRRVEKVGPATHLVRATGRGWELVEAGPPRLRIEGRSGLSPVWALDRALEQDWFRSAREMTAGRKVYVPIREFGEDVGRWRWVDATAQEDADYTPEETASGLAGVLLSERMIDEMVSNLAARLQPVQLDGVESGVHESVGESDAYAPGWAYVGVKGYDADGRAHLFLRVQVRPDVDEAMDSGRLAWGSVAFWQNGVEPYTGERIGAELISYALTNQPFVQGLMPHSAVRSGATETVALGRSRRHTMGKQPASARSKMHDAIDTVIEAVGAVVAEERTDSPAAAAARKEPIMPKREETAAADAVQAPPAKPGVADTVAGWTEEEKTEALGLLQPTAPESTDAKSRARELRDRVATLESEASAKDARIAALEQAGRTSALRTKFVAAIESAGRVAPSVEEIDKRVARLERVAAGDLDDAISDMLAALPPAGTVLAGQKQSAPVRGAGDRSAIEQLIATHAEQAKKDNPALSDLDARGEGYRRAKQAQPDAFKYRIPAGEA